MKISQEELRRRSAKLIGIQVIQTKVSQSPRGVGIAFIPVVRMENGILAVLGSYATETTLN